MHAWGMTEMSPLGTVARFKRGELEPAARPRASPSQPSRAGRIFGVRDEDRRRRRQRAAAGTARRSGDLLVRGPWIVKRLFQGRGQSQFARGWLVPDRRCRHHRRRRLHADHRPLEGRDQVGRRMDQHRSISRTPPWATRRGRGRGDRLRASQVGRAAADDRGASRRRGRRTKGDARSSSRARSPSGGCRTTWCSSSDAATAPQARS